MSLRAGLDASAEQPPQPPSQLVTAISSLEVKVRLATISAEDKELGKLIGESHYLILPNGRAMVLVARTF
jgi:hypothetical protein